MTLRVFATVALASAKPLKFMHITKTAGTAIEDYGHAHGLSWGRFHSYDEPEYGFHLRTTSWNGFPWDPKA